MLDVLTRADLRAQGLTAREITAAVARAELVRVRRGHYVQRGAPDALLRAARIGGRLGCLSLLAVLGVFVFDSSVLHVHMQHGDSRMRSGTQTARPLPRRQHRKRVVLHWRSLTAPPSSGCVDIVDALIHAVGCQTPRHAVATLDSALNQGLLDSEQLDEVFGALPRRFHVLRELLDGRAQSGTETLVRLMLRGLGCTFDLQVAFPGVGSVDLVADGWLVIECDSKTHHSDWGQQRADYRRDRALAALGYCVLRLTAEDILYRPELVLDAIRGLVRTARRTA